LVIVDAEDVVGRAEHVIVEVDQVVLKTLTGCNGDLCLLDVKIGAEQTNFLCAPPAESNAIPVCSIVGGGKKSSESNG
jgi:hypothetical protein